MVFEDWIRVLIASVSDLCTTLTVTVLCCLFWCQSFGDSYFDYLQFYLCPVLVLKARICQNILHCEGFSHLKKMIKDSVFASVISISYMLFDEL